MSSRSIEWEHFEERERVTGPRGAVAPLIPARGVTDSCLVPLTVRTVVSTAHAHCSRSPPRGKRKKFTSIERWQVLQGLGVRGVQWPLQILRRAADGAHPLPLGQCEFTARSPEHLCYGRGEEDHQPGWVTRRWGWRLYRCQSLNRHNKHFELFSPCDIQ